MCTACDAPRATEAPSGTSPAHLLLEQDVVCRQRLSACIDLLRNSMAAHRDVVFMPMAGALRCVPEYRAHVSVLASRPGSAGRLQLSCWMDHSRHRRGRAERSRRVMWRVCRA